MRPLAHVLEDGHPDYEISLTAAGREYIESGKEFDFSDVDLPGRGGERRTKGLVRRTPFPRHLRKHSSTTTRD
jgi:hypothetical protein